MARTSITVCTGGRPIGISMVRASASKAGSALGGTNTTDTHMHTPAIAGGQGPATDGGGHRPRIDRTPEWAIFRPVLSRLLMRGHRLRPGPIWLRHAGRAHGCVTGRSGSGR